jgi:acetate kinase
MTAVHTSLPATTNVACFDSGFHATMPAHVTTYAINQDVARSKGLRKYGFHGLSYSYILRAVSQHLSKPADQTNLIALHLGSGASACAVQGGNSIDTTMGLTPVSGLPGGTRSGDIDPSLIFHFTSSAGKLSPSSTKELHISRAEEILNKESGWKALTGTSDFAEIARKGENVPESHRLALDIFVDRIVGYVGSYFVKLEGKVDALVFAGGIGEKSAYLRELVVGRCRCLGFVVDQGKNEGVKGDEIVEDITGEAEKGKPRTLVVQTDEDWEMAFRTMNRPK